MRLRQVGENLVRIVDLKIARWKICEMRLDFFVTESRRHETLHFVGEKFALPFFRAEEICPTAEDFAGSVIQRPEQRIFESIPEFIARAHGIGKSVERQ